MIQVYSVEDFYQNYYQLLLEEEAVAQLIIGNLKACRQSNNVDALFAILQEEDEQYFVCYYPPYSILVTPFPNRKQNEKLERQAGEELAKYLEEHSIQVRGINASKSIVLGFVEYFAKRNIPMNPSIDMDIMELREVTYSAQQGQLEYASVEDLELLSLLYINFTVEALGDAPQIELTREKLTQWIEKKLLYVLKVEEKIVAMCATPRLLEKGVSISAVYTIPQYRHKGYCKSMISQLCKKFLNEGKEFLCLYVDCSNPYSNAAYEAVGFKTVGSCCEYVFKEG